MKESVVENRVAVNMEDVVHQSVFKFDVPSFLICIAQAWPCWLPSILSFHLGIKGAYFPSRLHKFFPFSPSIVDSAGGWSSLDKARLLSELPINSIALIWFSDILPIISKSDEVPFVHVLEIQFELFNKSRLGNYMRAKSRRVEHWGSRWLYFATTNSVERRMHHICAFIMIWCRQVYLSRPSSIETSCEFCHQR